MSAYFKAPASDRRNPLFSFQGFEMYAARREDLWLAMLWTGMDRHHREVFDPTFWITPEPGVETYLVADRKGWLFFFRLSRAVMKLKDRQQSFRMVRIHIQFAPYAERGVPLPAPPACVPLTTETRRKAAMPMDRVRTMRALVLGCEWLQRAMEPLGVSALCFESESPTLIRFCEKHMGFSREGMWLIKWLAGPRENSDGTRNDGDISHVL